MKKVLGLLLIVVIPVTVVLVMHNKKQPETVTASHVKQVDQRFEDKMAPLRNEEPVLSGKIAKADTGLARAKKSAKEAENSLDTIQLPAPAKAAVKKFEHADSSVQASCDSVIAGYKAMLAVKDSEILVLSLYTDTLTQERDALLVENSQLKAKMKRKNLEVIGAAVIGFLLGKL